VLHVCKLAAMRERLIEELRNWKVISRTFGLLHSC